MATIHNRKMESFVSPFPHPTAAAIDVLTVDWNRRNQVYVFPPKTFMMLLLPKAPLVPKPRGPRSSLATSSFKEAFEMNFADRDFSLLAKAQFHLSPPTQRKLPKWSLNHSLKTLHTPRFRNNTASMEDLFLKTNFFVAVASGNRCSELAACTREGISFDSNTVTIPSKKAFSLRTKPWTERLLQSPFPL